VLGFFVCGNVASKCDIMSYLVSFQQNRMRSWLVKMPPIKGGAPPVGSAQDGFDKGGGRLKQVQTDFPNEYRTLT